MPQLWQALSIKQPWAALILHGIKTIEVRSWRTGKRGPILLHASKSVEPDPAAWNFITTPPLMEAAGLVGGIIGIVELYDCITYPSREAFVADAGRHFAGPDRFRPPAMYGFKLRQPRPVAFVPWLGNTNFFGVDADIDPKPVPRKKHERHSGLIVRLPEQGPR